ncbi:efflux RND transporter periplasmic adaptor subunit [Dongia sp.]|uniref:efflux RND transporter periplasmic adaptor subunit n=1 Tax=Dongia sp. TaxID=1977262 RepID=UPI0035B08522
MLKHLLLAAGFLFAFVPGLSAQESADNAPAQQVLTVGTVPAARQEISKSLSFVGRVEAIERVEIVARISGYLEEILFQEGGTVQAGDPLYTIEKGLYEAALQQAQGSVESAKASVVLAEQQRSRTSELLSKEVASQMTMDQRLAAVQSAKGDAATSAANVKTAEINLGYTDIKAPIGGRIGRTSVTKGNVVGPSSGTLTVIVSQDPMYVVFPVSQREFLRTREAGQGANPDKLVVRLQFSDGAYYDQTGKVDFVDVTTDRDTDTITVRAIFPNPKSVLVDGQLVNVELASDKPEEAVMVPQSALLADQSGPYLFVVEDSKAVVKRVKLGGEHGANVVISEGLSGGELVIVEGLQFVRPDMPVNAAPISAADPS